MAALIAILVLTGLIWLTAVLVRGGPLAGVLLVLSTGTCFGYIFFHLETGVVPLTIDRALFALLMLQCLVWRRLGLLEPKPFGRVELVLGLLLVALVISVATHDWTYQRNLPASKLLFYYLMPAGIYWVTRQLRLTETTTRWVFGFLTVLGVYIAGIAIAEWLRWRGLIFPRYIASSDYRDFLGRARGPLMNPAANGYFLAIGLCATWMWWPRFRWRVRTAIVALTVLFAAATYATLTRCVWLGALGTSLIIAALTLPRSWRLPLVTGTLMTIAAVGATQWDRIMQFKRDEGHSERETIESAKLRPVLAVVAWRMFLKQPVFGCGFGHYREKFTEVLDDRSSELPLDTSRRYVQHNVFLGLLSETGLVGTALFIMLLGYWLRDAWRRWRSPAPLWARQHALLFLATSASYFANGMFQDLAIIPMINMMLFFLAGLIAGLKPDDVVGVGAA